MVTTSGFASTPLSRALVVSIVLTSLATSILDIKYLLPIQPTPHLWPYLQFSRILTFQLAYISSTELLFAVVLLYQLRVLERLWGPRKFGSFVVLNWSICAVGISVLGVMLKVITWGRWEYIPPGMTGLVVAMASVWKDEVPGLYNVKVVSGIGSSDSAAVTAAAQGRDGSSRGQRRQEQQQQQDEGRGVVLSDKFTAYLLAGQLALSQFPYQLLPALVGWIAGVAWREELLPMGLIRWRIPAWMVGETSDGKPDGGQYEGLRRRLEEEGGVGDGMREVSDGVARGSEGGQQTQQQQQNRGIGRGIMGYFTGS